MLSAFALTLLVQAHAEEKLKLPSSSTVMDCGKPDPRQTLKDGTYTCTNYYKKTTPNAKFTLKNGKLEGKALGYRENGEPEFDGTYQNGLLDGEIKTNWNEKAKRFNKSTHYRAGKRQGVQVEITDNENNNYRVSQFKDDEQNGYVYLYRQGKVFAADDCEIAGQRASNEKCDVLVIPGYESAWNELKKQKQEKADKDHSDANREVVRKNRAGVMIERYTLKNSQVWGKHEHFFENGKLALVSEEEKSRKLNETEYFDDGQLKRKSVYDKGFETSHEEHYQNGKMKATWTRKPSGNWDYTETFKEYYDNGQLALEGQRLGKIDGYGADNDGEIKSYDRSGAPATIEHYKNGKREGPQKSFGLDENKKPIAIDQVYENGKLVKSTTTDVATKKVLEIQEFFPDGSIKSEKKF